MWSLYISTGLILVIGSGCCSTAHPRCTEPTPAAPCSRYTACMNEIDVLAPCSIENENLTANELIDIALRNNPETRVSWASARAAAYRLQASKSTLYPSVAAEAGYAVTYQNFSGGHDDVTSGIIVITDPAPDENGLIDPSTGIAFGEFIGGEQGTTQVFVSDLSASYLLFDCGKRCASIAVAREALHLANWSHNRTIQNVIIDVLYAYYAYLSAQALLEAQNDDLKDAETNLQAALELFQSGVKTQLDVLQSKSQLLNIQVGIEESKGIVQMQRGNLANALGYPANTPLHIAELPKEMAMEETVDSIENLMETAKQKRPDLAASLSDYKKKQAELAYTLADGLPSVSLNGDIERVDGISNSVASGFVYSGSLSVEMPLFQGFYFTNRRRAAKAQVAAAFANLQAKESDVLLDVWNSYYAFKTAVKTFQYSEEFLKYTELTYEAAMESYKEGTGCILDLLAAQKALSRARAQKIQARTEWVTSLAGIAYATGTL